MRSESEVVAQYIPHELRHHFCAWRYRFARPLAVFARAFFLVGNCFLRRGRLVRRNPPRHWLTSGHLVLPDAYREDFPHLLGGLPLRIPARQRGQPPRGPAGCLRLSEDVPVNRRGGREILVERRFTIEEDSAGS